MLGTQKMEPQLLPVQFAKIEITVKHGAGFLPEAGGGRLWSVRRRSRRIDAITARERYGPRLEDSQVKLPEGGYGGRRQSRHAAGLRMPRGLRDVLAKVAIGLGIVQAILAGGSDLSREVNEHTGALRMSKRLKWLVGSERI